MATKKTPAQKAAQPSPIRVAREAMGLTRAKTAEQAGISPGYLKVVERGDARPSRETCEKLAPVLNVPLQQLLAAYHPALRLPGTQASAASPAPGVSQGIESDIQRAVELALNTLSQLHSGQTSDARAALFGAQEALARAARSLVQ